MSAERWRRVERLFHEALAQGETARGAFLAAACAGDAELEAEVESLLVHAQRSDALLEHDALDEAALLADDAPATTSLAGSELGPYRLERRIGAGGMGEVYLARDGRLGRAVALKLLDPSLVADPRRRARFLKEARLAALLDHPSICAIHEVGEHDGRPFIAMQLVEGMTLRDATGGRPLPSEALLDIALQVGEALAFAHERGIIHRDVKATNVMVTPQGQAKVLDFGIAKRLEVENVDVDGAGAPRTEGTAVGTVLGTPGSMSPEQASGARTDQRSDVFSFGVLLYEMATGRPPFQGGTWADLMSAVLHEAHRPLVADALPPGLPAIVDRALAKQPAERYQTMEELLADLRAATTPGAVIAPTPIVSEAAAASAPRRRSVARTIAIAVVFVAATIAIAWFFVARATRAPSRAAIPGGFTRLTDQAGLEHSPRLSPDGDAVIYVAGPRGNNDIFLQRLGGEGNAINLTASCARDDRAPAYSFDGRRIAFRSECDGGGIFVMSAGGGARRRVSAAGQDPAWSPDGREIAVTEEAITETPLYRVISRATLVAVEVESGRRRMLLAEDAVQPAWSPHGHRVAFWRAKGGGQRDLLTVGARRPSAPVAPVAVTADAAVDWNPVWSPDGRFLYFVSDRGGVMNLWRVPIDERSGRPLGEPQPLTTPTQWPAGLSFSRDGRRMAYAALDQRTTILTRSFDPEREEVGPAVTVLRGSRLVSSQDLSPDGQWIAFASSLPQEDIHVMRVDGSSQRRLTADRANDRAPRWSPDGSEIAFYSSRGGKAYDVWTARADGSSLRAVTVVDREGLLFPLWSPDGKRILATRRPSNVVILDRRRAPRDAVLEVLPSIDRNQAFVGLSWSPDGRSVAGTGFREGRVSVHVYTFGTRTYRKVADGGSAPVWLADSRRLLVDFPDGIAVVDTVTGRQRRIAPPAGWMAPITPWTLSLSRDQRTLSVLESVSEGDVWLATLADAPS